MTPEEFSSALAKIADQTVTSNFESIKEHLLDGVLSTDSRDELIGKMLANAIRLSVNLSVSATMSGDSRLIRISVWTDSASADPFNI